MYNWNEQKHLKIKIKQTEKTNIMEKCIGQKQEIKEKKQKQQQLKRITQKAQICKILRIF